VKLSLANLHIYKDYYLYTKFK